MTTASPIIKSARVYQTIDGRHYAYVVSTAEGSSFIPLKPLGRGWDIDEDTGAKVPIEVLGATISDGATRQRVTFGVPMTLCGPLEIGAPEFLPAKDGAADDNPEAMGEPVTD